MAHDDVRRQRPRVQQQPQLPAQEHPRPQGEDERLQPDVGVRRRRRARRRPSGVWRAGVHSSPERGRRSGRRQRAVVAAGLRQRAAPRPERRKRRLARRAGDDRTRTRRASTSSPEKGMEGGGDERGTVEGGGAGRRLSRPAASATRPTRSSRTRWRRGSRAVHGARSSGAFVPYSGAEDSRMSRWAAATTAPMRAPPAGQR